MASSATVLQPSDYDTLHTLFESLKDDMINKKTAFLTSIGVIHEGWTYTQYDRGTQIGEFSERYPSEIDNPLYKEAIAAEELYNSYISGEIIPEGFTEEQIHLYHKEKARRRRDRFRKECIEMRSGDGVGSAQWNYECKLAEMYEHHLGLPTYRLPRPPPRRGGRRNYKNTIKNKIRRVKSYKRTRKSRNV